MQNLHIEYKDNIARITITRPKALNAINSAVMEGLNAFYSEGWQAYEGLYGVILSGEGGKAFAAGADIKEFTALSLEQTIEKSKYGHETYHLIEGFHVPTIAVIDGFALGGGCELAMACQMRIATPTSKFGQPEVNLGLLPGYGGTQRLVQLIGKARAFEYLLTANMMDADLAERLGLVNYVLEREEAFAKAEKLLNKIGSKGPNAVAACIQAVNRGVEDSKAGYTFEAEMFGQTMVSAEAKEGVDAFINKRKPNFR